MEGKRSVKNVMTAFQANSNENLNQASGYIDNKKRRDVERYLLFMIPCKTQGTHFTRRYKYTYTIVHTTWELQ